MKKFFKCKIFKIPVHVGMTCPNRDGTRGTEGCIYCDNRSFSPYTRSNTLLSLEKQIRHGIRWYRANNDAEKFIIYFQSYTNTYCNVETLKSLYDKAISFDEVVGIAIGTRPDCINNKILDLIESYAKRYHIWVEYGLQSSWDQTLKLINRGHTYQEFVNAVYRTKKRDNIFVLTHIILGLPGEDKDMMLETVKRLSSLPIDGIKFHHLYIAKNTVLEEWYKQDKVKLLSLEEFIDILVDSIELLPPRVIIQRMIGELEGEYVIAPRWGKKKHEILTLIREEFERRNSRQGKFFKHSKDGFVKDSITRKELANEKL